MFGKTHITRLVLFLSIVFVVSPIKVLGYWEDLDITSPSPEFCMLIFDSDYYHLFYFGGEEKADSIRMALITKYGLLKDDIVVYEAGTDCTLTGLSAGVIGNGYVIAFFEIDEGKGKTNLNVLGVGVDKQPYGGTGPTAEEEKITIKKTTSKTVVGVEHSNLIGVDTRPIGETLIFGIEERKTNDKKQKMGVNGVVSLADSKGTRKLDVLSASFNIKFKKLNVYAIKINDHSSKFSSYTDVYPTRNGGGGAVLNRAFWYWRLASVKDGAPPAFPTNYRVELFTNKKNTFPKQTDVEISEYEADSEFQWDFSGYDVNHSRSFYVDIRYRHEGGDRYPNRLVGYERLDSGRRINPQNYGLYAPDTRDKPKKNTYEWDYIVRDVLLTKKERNVNVAAIKQQEYTSKKNKKIYDNYIEMTNWSLLKPGGPNGFHTEKVSLGREVFDIHLVQFKKSKDPIFAIYSYVDHNAAAPNGAGGEYGFTLFYFKFD